MKKKDLLTLFDYSADEVRGILGLAAKLKEGRGISEKRVLEGKTGVLIFEKPSLRTRVSFETAIHELGGHAIFLGDSAGMDKRESVEDVARNLERLVHLVVARTFSHDTLTRLASSCRVSVINALTDRSHPCQALAFGLVAQARRPGERLNIVFVGDGNNVCSSIMVLCAMLGHNFTVAGPNGYGPSADLVEKCRTLAAAAGGSTTVTGDLCAAVRDADFVYTDVWASMGQETEAEARKAAFRGYQVNAELMALAPAGALVSHCLPARRGEEITGDVLDSDVCVAYEEAENRLHVQKAVIVHLFS